MSKGKTRRKQEGVKSFKYHSLSEDYRPFSLINRCRTLRTWHRYDTNKYQSAKPSFQLPPALRRHYNFSLAFPSLVGADRVLFHEVSTKSPTLPPNKEMYEVYEISSATVGGETDVIVNLYKNRSLIGSCVSGWRDGC